MKLFQTKTTIQFIKEAIVVHGLRYSYSKANYKKATENIVIFCRIHGEFNQTPHTHLKGSGCPFCINQIKLNPTLFRKKAELVHGKNCYDYSLIKKIYNNKTKVPIVCPKQKHGIFYQRPNDHLNKNGCPKCANNKKLTKKEIVSRAMEKHKCFYDYTLLEYNGIDSYGDIICPKHGNFKQKIYEHLKGSGCPQCAKVKKITSGQKKLYDIFFDFDKNVKIEHPIKLQNKTYYVDIFIPTKDLIIEYHGDYWHCNPKKYKPNYLHPHNKKLAIEIWEHDKQKKQILERFGYKVLIVWESDFKKGMKNSKKLGYDLIKKGQII